MSRITSLVCVLLLGLYVGSWLWTLPRDLTPPISVHANDLQAAQWAAAFRSGRPHMVNGELRADTPPMSPSQARVFMLEQVLSNDLRPDLYFTSSPITYVLASIPSLTLGFSPRTLRAGPLVVMLVLLGATCWLGWGVAGPVAGVGAACMVGLYPMMIGASRTCFPTTGKMAGVALTLALLYHSDAMRRPFWSLASGISLALCLRWGESVGDGIVTLATTIGPAMLMVMVALVRSIREGPVRWLGPMLMGASLYYLADFDWVRLSLSTYILREAHLESGSGLSSLSRIWQEGWVYVWAVRYRLVGLVGTVAVAVAWPILGWRLSPRWKWLGLTLAVLIPWALLTVSEKRHAYYITPVLPVLAVMVSAGLALVPRVGPGLVGLVVALMLPGWARLTWDGEMPSLSPRVWLAEELLRTDVLRINGLTPLPLDDDIRAPGVGDPTRRQVFEKIEQTTRSHRTLLPRGSVVVVQGATPLLVDVVGYRLLALRPDLHIITVTSPQEEKPSWIYHLERAPGHLILTVEEEATTSLPQGPSPGPPLPPLPPPTWLGPVTLLEQSGGIKIYQLNEQHLP